jgi:hypothetical protein
MNAPRRPHPLVIALLFLGSVTAVAQQPFGTLVAGRSTRAEVEKVLGRPIAKPSATLVEYAPPAGLRAVASKIYVQYRADSHIADRLESLLWPPQDRRVELARQGITERPAFSRINPRGALEEYYGAPMFIVLTYARADEDGGVARSARYSKELFAHVIRQLEQKK